MTHKPRYTFSEERTVIVPCAVQEGWCGCRDGGGGSSRETSTGEKSRGCHEQLWPEAHLEETGALC